MNYIPIVVQFAKQNERTRGYTDMPFRIFNYDRYISIDEVYAIHLKMIEIGGGRGNIHDFTLLHSAVERPRATFGGKDLYPTIWGKAAALIHSLIKNHPFDDGNKRTAYYSTMRFLYTNGYQLSADKNSVIRFTKGIDVQNYSLEKIETWLKRHTKKAIK